MKRIASLLLFSLLLAALSACNLPSAPGQPQQSATHTVPALPEETLPPQQPTETAQPPATPLPTATQLPPQPSDPSDPSGDSPIIIDHECTDITRIPVEWLDKAKELSLALAHTSHGSQIVTGLLWLQSQDPQYAVALRSTWEGLGLPDAPGSLRLYDGNNVPEDDYITPELYWATDEGLNYTRSVVESGWFNYSMWSWCGQQSENSEETVWQYINTLADLQAQYPEVQFIYMTGHTDGNWDGSRLLENNQIVRSYAVENQKVLFDFADIESYDPDGNYYPNTDDSCPWCEDWCNTHPEDCANLDQMGDCAHSHPLQCKLKAQAFWWMMARLAGWEGE